jgi:AcrR family transcriptional regulator
MAKRVHVKTGYHHGNLREELVTAALAIIARKGSDALTLREVANRLGVSQTALYRHFAGKEELRAAVAADGFTSLHRAIEEETAAAGPDVRGRYRAIGLAYIRFALAHPAHFAIMYGPRSEGLVVGQVAEAGRAAFDLMVDAVVACQRAGKAPRGDPRRVAVEAWSLAHGLATLYLHGMLPRRLGVRELREAARRIDLFLLHPTRKLDRPANRARPAPGAQRQSSTPVATSRTSLAVPSGFLPVKTAPSSS